jgi:SAM-dependent methyltransferase
MDFFELKNISERYLELLNPTTPDKLIHAGRIAGLAKGSSLIDYGCGYGAELLLWARAFGISGLGIDIRPAACDRARAAIKAQGFEGQLEVVCGNAGEYRVEPQSYDIAACIGATFCWKGGFKEAVHAMKAAVKPGGRLVVGEVSWTGSQVPTEYAQRESFIKTEYELLQMAREEGLEIIYVLHSSHDDWDHYQAENWRGLSDWLDENPTHPQRADVLQHLHESQEEYLRYEREYLGWALYVLKPGSD